MARRRKILSPAKRGKISLRVVKAAVKQVIECGRFRISYLGKPRVGLDAAFEKLAERYGYEFYASGYNFKTDVRDIAFEYMDLAQEKD